LVGLIGVGGVAGAALLYQGILNALSRNWIACIGPLTCGIVAGFGVFFLCRHRNDLLCS
jgi:hypothetical protein